MRIKKNDMVVVLTGRDKGRRGRVLDVVDGRERLIVEGVNTIKRHVKAGQDPKAPQGGIIDASSAIQISNVKLVCGHCNQPTKAGLRKLEDGKKVRFCKKCKESLDK